MFASHPQTTPLESPQHATATAATRALAEYRVGTRDVAVLPYHVDYRFCPKTTLRLLPAGHVFGSAMLHVARPEGTLLYTGDFKLRECLTVETAQPTEADVLVMESTFGQRFFRFPPWRQVVEQLVELLAETFMAGRQPIVLGYSLGKSQEDTRILTDAGFRVTVHGAVFNTNRIYEEHGVKLGPYGTYNAWDFHGPRALALEERGVLVAPPNVARTGFVSNFDNPCRIILTGWAMLKNASYPYGVDHALPLSDHADLDELLELVERVRPTKIYSHHGYPQFADILRARGHDAELARPDEQLQ